MFYSKLMPPTQIFINCLGKFPGFFAPVFLSYFCDDSLYRFGRLVWRFINGNY